MKRIAIAVLATMFAFPAVYAQEAPVTLEGLNNKLDELIGKLGKDRVLEELSIRIAEENAPLKPLNGNLADSTDSSGRITIKLIVNAGKCNDQPPNPDHLLDNGFYISSFCDHPQPNHAWGDAHGTGSGGSLGDILGWRVFDCAITSEAFMWPPKARDSFCND